MSQVLGQVAVIRQNKQAFSLRVETADIEEPGEFCRKQLKNRLARVWVAPGRNEPRWFVQNNRKRNVDPRQPAIHFDMIARSRLRTEIGADLAINGHTTGGN